MSRRDWAETQMGQLIPADQKHRKGQAEVGRAYFSLGTQMAVSNYFLLHYLFFLSLIFLSPCCVFSLVVCF